MSRSISICDSQNQSSCCLIYEKSLAVLSSCCLLPKEKYPRARAHWGSSMIATRGIWTWYFEIPKVWKCIHFDNQFIRGHSESKLWRVMSKFCFTSKVNVLRKSIWSDRGMLSIKRTFIHCTCPSNINSGNSITWNSVNSCQTVIRACRGDSNHLYKKVITILLESHCPCSSIHSPKYIPISCSCKVIKNPKKMALRISKIERVCDHFHIVGFGPLKYPCIWPSCHHSVGGSTVWEDVGNIEIICICNDSLNRSHGDCCRVICKRKGFKIFIPC